jgi:tetratricopeptide (TPR) repeat protein
VIEEKIKKARQSVAKRRMYLGAGLFAAICLCGLWVFGLSFFDFSEKKSVPAVTSPKETLSDTSLEKAREEFKERLEQYERELGPRLQTVNLERWDRVFLEITGLKKKVMTNFSSGDYGIAMENLQLLEDLTVMSLKKADHIFEENVEKATVLLAEDRYDGANFHIEKALLVNPQSPDALRLQEKIEKLPQLLPLLNGVKAARAENDLQKEYDFLQQVLIIAPEREGIMDRLGVLSGLIKTQKFDGHISSGFTGIEKRRAKEARYHYQEAQRIDSHRLELSLLQTQLLALERSLRVEQAVKQAEQAIRRDDWQQAKHYFARAAKDAPENKTVAQGLKQSDHVLRLLDGFRFFLKNPYRLTLADVRKEAQQTLVAAEAASNYSFTIKRKAEELRELIFKVNRPIPVTVISDNKTYVLVRSVGRVGIVSQKTIELKPGNYTFEGTRKGFKSKLVKALIPYDQSVFSIQVICDEPI